MDDQELNGTNRVIPRIDQRVQLDDAFITDLLVPEKSKSALVPLIDDTDSQGWGRKLPFLLLESES